MLRQTTIDPTHNSLDAAILDQKVAGLMGDDAYAYVKVTGEGAKPWAIGIAVEHEAGYSPISGMEFATEAEADAFVDGMNRHIGLDARRAMEIVCSTMRRVPAQ
jgi:hypothetical protein